MKTMKTDTGNETWMGLVKNNVTRAAMLLVMMLICLTAEAQDIEYYDLYLGSWRVSSDDKDNILNEIKDGQPTAKFDPETSTLTLNNPTINDYRKIKSGLPNLTITGSYHMTEADEKLQDGIQFSGSSLTLNGDFTFYCGEYGRSVYFSDGKGTLTLNGNIVLNRVEIPDGNIIVNSGSLLVKGEDTDIYTDIYCSKLIVRDGVDYVQYKRFSVTLELADGYIEDSSDYSRLRLHIIHKSDIDF